MGFTSPVSEFFLYEINLYPYLTWFFYFALAIFSPYWFTKEERLFTLFLISLAFESAFAFEAGFFIRPSYVLGLILIFRMWLKGINFPAKYTILFILFVTISILGIFLNLDLIGKAQSGETRATFLRPLIQIGQLTTLIFITVSVYSFLKEKNYFYQTTRILHWTSVGVALYALWEIAAIYLNLPYLNLDSMRPQYWYIGFGTPFVYMFRPHVTFIEPIELNNFQLFGIASSLAYYSMSKNRHWSYWLLFALQFIMLLGSFSRSTLFTLFVLGPFFVLFYPRKIRTALGFIFERGTRIIIVMVLLFIAWYGITTNQQELKKAPILVQTLYARLIFHRSDFTAQLSILGRAEAIKELQALSDKNKLAFGVGIGNDANWWGGVGGANSLYNQIIIFSGLIGASIFIIFLSLILYGLTKQYWNRYNTIIMRRSYWIFFIGFLGMLIQRVSFSGLLTDTYLWVAFGVGIYLGENQKSQKEIQT